MSTHAPSSILKLVSHSKVLVETGIGPRANLDWKGLITRTRGGIFLSSPKSDSGADTQHTFRTDSIPLETRNSRSRLQIQVAARQARTSGKKFRHSPHCMQFSSPIPNKLNVWREKLRLLSGSQWKWHMSKATTPLVGMFVVVL